MRILICDDEPLYLDMMQSHVEEYMRLHQICFTITAVTDPTDILNGDDVFDLAFLDVQMPRIDGITMARMLRRRNSKLALFFITNYEEYQDDAMDLQAFRFLEKPFHAPRLYAGLDKAMEYIDGAYVDLYLADNGDQQRIIADDILYVTRNGRRATVVTDEKAYPVEEKYDNLCARLPQLFFYPVHKSFLVNLHSVERYTYHELVLTDGTHVPIAPRKQASFHQFWFDYLRRR